MLYKAEGEGGWSLAEPPVPAGLECAEEEVAPGECLLGRSQVDKWRVEGLGDRGHWSRGTNVS